ncbi:GNAT family N-acetyltransferase [Sphingobacterium anhuiense]|uniref:GNAT family N-acetyltransferase n=1 Tax=Sphingobacterium anhuiense TaxID=493780 RepID=A0ABW5YSV7_9SPHI
MTTQLTFKKYTEEDFSDYLNLVKEDDLMQYITGKGLSETDAKRRFAFILDLGQQHNALGYFQVLDTATGQIIGDCKLVFYKRNIHIFEIGYLVRKEHWRQGLGTKICEYLLSQASTVNKENDVIAVIHPENIASRKLLEKFNFESYFKGNEDGTTIEKLILKRS